MTRAEEIDALLADLYAQVPDIACRGLCTDSCGPIDGGHREMVRLRRAGVHLPPLRVAIRIMASTPDNYECPALVDGACSTYEVRPMVCRIWGASEDLPCPYGCAPTTGQLLTSAQTQALLDAANKAGTLDPPLTAAEIERRLADPATARRYRQYIPRPVATRPLPRTGDPRP